MPFVYFDSSAAVKLFKEEPESADLEAWLNEHQGARWVTSDLTRTELRRALHGANINPDTFQDAETWLDDCAVVRLTPKIYDQAGNLPDTQLRSLEAIHAAAALTLGEALTAVVAYDDRLLKAAREQGLPAVRPAKGSRVAEGGEEAGSRS